MGLKENKRMSFVDTPKEKVEIGLPEEARILDVWKRLRDAIKRFEKEFADEYKISNITAGVSITASIPPSFTGSVSATLTKE